MGHTRQALKYQTKIILTKNVTYFAKVYDAPKTFYNFARRCQFYKLFMRVTYECSNISWDVLKKTLHGSMISMDCAGYFDKAVS